MSQVILFVAIHLLGLVVTLALGPRSRPVLCCALGFPVGLATLVLAVLALLVVGIPYRLESVALLGGAVAAASLVVLVRRGVGRRALIAGAAWTVGLALASIVPSSLNLSLMSHDSHQFVMLGRIIGADQGFAPGVLAELQAWGVFQVIAESLTVLTPEPYLYGLHPVLGVSFAALFAVSLWHGAVALGAARSAATAAIVALVTVALFTVGMLVLHLFYVHTNLAAAVYLFGFVVLYWLAEVTEEPAAVPVALLCLLAFALTRIETTPFAVICLALAVLPSRLPRRALAPGLTVFTIALVGWFLLLSRHAPAGGEFLTPGRCYVIAGGVAAFYAYWLVPPGHRLRRLDRSVPWLLLAACVVGLIFAYRVHRRNTIDSFTGWADNLTMLPQWGQSWYLIAGLVIAGLLLESPPARRIFTVGIPVYFVYLLMLSLGRKPYYYYVGDSANRMTLHVLALIFFYLGLKLATTLARRRLPPVGAAHS